MKSIIFKREDAETPMFRFYNGNDLEIVDRTTEIVLADSMDKMDVALYLSIKAGKGYDVRTLYVRSSNEQNYRWGIKVEEKEE